MAWFRLTNNSSLPIHAQLSNAGIPYYHKNNIGPLLPSGERGYEEWDIGGAAGWDLTIVPASGNNEFTGDAGAAIAAWVVRGAGMLVAAGGVALLPFSAGSSAALVATGIATAAGGVATTVAELVVMGVGITMQPLTVNGLYAPYGYNFDVRGGEIHYKPDEHDSGKIIVTGYSPLSVSWHNNTTGTHGTIGK